jgi:hypothetical protein
MYEIQMSTGLVRRVVPVKPFLIVVTAILLLWTTHARAALVTFDYTANWNGQIVPASFTWNNAATVQVGGGYDFYRGAVTQVEFDGHSFDPASDVNNIVYVFINYTGLSGYRIELDDGPNLFDLHLYSSNVALVSSYALPMTFPPVSDFDNTNILGFGTADGFNALASVTAISPGTSVPEPSTAALWGAAVLLLAGLRRKNAIGSGCRGR